MFEGTSISEGRGTARPFEVCFYLRTINTCWLIFSQIMGAPWITELWTMDMRSLHVPGTDYRFQCFIPSTSKFANQTACGLQVYVASDLSQDIAMFDPVFVGVSLLWSAHRLYSNGSSTSANRFSWKKVGDEYNIDLLTGGTLIRESIDRGLSPSQIRGLWEDELEAFRRRRALYLLYE